MTDPDEHAGSCCAACTANGAYTWGRLAGYSWALVRVYVPGATLPAAATLPGPPVCEPLPHCPGSGLLRLLGRPDDGSDILAEWRHLVGPVPVEFRPAVCHGILSGVRDALRLPSDQCGLRPAAEPGDATATPT